MPAVLYATTDELAAGDVVCRVSTSDSRIAVAKALPGVLAIYGLGFGIASQAAGAGGAAVIAIDTPVPTSVHGLTGGPSKVRIGSDGRPQKVSAFSAGDYPLGHLDARNYLTLLPQMALGALPVAVPTGGAYAVTGVATDDVTAVAGQILKVDPRGGALEVQLPTAVGKTGQAIVVKNVAPPGVSGSDNDVTLLPFGAELIDGVASIVLDTAGGVQAVISDGAGWMAAPGTIAAPEPLFHELVSSPVHAWDAASITFSGMSLTTWQAIVGGSTLMPDGTGNGYLEDDNGYSAATFTGGGKLSGAAVLSQAGGTWGIAARFRAVATHGLAGAVVGFVTSPTPDAKWAVMAVYADAIATARIGQVALSGGDNMASNGTGVGTAWQVGFLEMDPTTIYLTIGGVTYTASRPAGTAPFNRINLGWLNYTGSSHLYPYSGAVSHVVTVDGRRFTAPERAALQAWTPPA